MAGCMASKECMAGSMWQGMCGRRRVGVCGMEAIQGKERGRRNDWRRKNEGIEGERGRKNRRKKV